MNDSRSYNMSRIRGKDTNPEMWLRKRLHGLGFRYRLHDKSLPGTPDLVFPKYRAVIFVNGCFWHMHQCRNFHFPNSSFSKGRGPKWWRDKLIGNRQRDLENIEKVRELGWRVLVLWECALPGKGKRKCKNNGEQTMEVITAVSTWLNGKQHYLEIPSPESILVHASERSL
ncbi:very short patch repair endonuclease [Shewanella aegiceratis]|uniref:very short patch repair endonuclease n=1 Tax=Shewanella aegiceratis TaxID=2864203 RepID=UPI001C65C23C|nr:very short patch repair endonuclease [Shewanella aegiceratis]QYJ82124.1 very short patch repair endonuclease [Shewanella aegiceratis]